MFVDFSCKFDKINVLEENRDFLIIEKPSGLLVHGDKYSRGACLVDLILKDYPEIKEIGQLGRSGIVHRLDKEASGLMVIARNKEMYNRLLEQFQGRKIKKEYLTLVYGCLKDNKGEINLPLGRNKKGKIIAVLYRKQIKQEKEAKTGYEVRQRFTQPQEFTLLNVFLFTGRTHQIRVHFKSIGHPIVGDKEHRIKNLKLEKTLRLNRLFLHACYLGFNDLQNNWREFRKDLPIELKNFLTELK
ncbi:MAG: RluA family pseudouridine synthase [Patescibacteria group bacterium]|jgi:23S rRNA pseudouridine1911/1915/1917 synthase|nr:RluA family pseudouridine synthase [Patescibacteria group bacterium]